MAKKLSHSFSSTEEFNCPKRYKAVRLDKVFKDDFSHPSALRGTRLHGEWEHALLHGNDVGDDYQWVMQYVREKFTGLKFAEKKLAINSRFEPCSWFDRDVFYRFILDVGVLSGSHIETIDYKTGKFRPKPRQGQEQVLAAFFHFPHLLTGTARFLWTDADAAPTVTHYDKKKDAERMVDELLDIPRAINKAIEDDNFPAKPDHHCNWCPVLSCEHNKKKIFDD